MSSIKKRIVIEEYINGGFGIFDQRGEMQEVMGLSTLKEVKKELDSFFKKEEKR